LEALVFGYSNILFFGSWPLSQGIDIGKMVFAKLIFFPPKFFLFRKISRFQNTKNCFGGKKLT
jgi:hypothetical protein